MSDAKITCPGCGDTHAAPGGDPDFLKHNVSACDICGARIAYGEILPGIVVEPGAFAGGQPAFILHFQDPVTKAELYSARIDPGLGFLLGQAIISMVRP